MQTKSLDLEVKIVANGSGAFEAYGSAFGVVDRVGDVTQKGTFARTIEEWNTKGRMPKLLWMHNQSEPIGVWVEMREDSKGLYMRGRLALETQRGREAYELLKMGAIDSFSIGYVVRDEEMKQGVNYLKDVDLLEVSLVSIPANDGALIQSVKSTLAKGQLPTKREVQDLLQKHCGFSKRDAEKAMNQFKDINEEPQIDSSELNSYTLFKSL